MEENDRWLSSAISDYRALCCPLNFVPTSFRIACCPCLPFDRINCWIELKGRHKSAIPLAAKKVQAADHVKKPGETTVFFHRVWKWRHGRELARGPSWWSCAHRFRPCFWVYWWWFIQGSTFALQGWSWYNILTTTQIMGSKLQCWELAYSKQALLKMIFLFWGEADIWIVICQYVSYAGSMPSHRSVPTLNSKVATLVMQIVPVPPGLLHYLVI